MKSKEKYIHTEEIHNMTGPRIVVKEILKVFSDIPINSVVDFGCGLGTWMRAFKENGVEKTIGYDGVWVNKDLLYKNIKPQEFNEIDFENIDKVKITSKYDLAICVEVAEHVSAQNANNLVQLLSSAADIIVFSAAVPKQGGFNHINEQFPDYWIQKFEQYGFKPYDALRMKLWENNAVENFYKQNIYIYIRENVNERLKSKLLDETPTRDNKIRTFIHYDTYFSLINMIDEVNPSRGVFFYFKLLLKRLLNYFKKR